MALLDPLLTSEASGALPSAIAELCAHGHLRRIDGWHYALR